MFCKLYRTWAAALLAASSLVAIPAANAQLIINEFMAANDGTLIDDFGESADWIELFNHSGTAVLLNGWRLSNTLGDTHGWALPNLSLPADAYLVIYASGRNITTNGLNNLHTDFKLDADGEYLALIKPDGNFATEFTPVYPPQAQDISYGFDGNASLRYFPTPTPLATNNNGVAGFVADTQFSIDRGFYTNAFTTEITAATPGATLVYTLDSSAPSLSNGVAVVGIGTNYPSAAINISTSTVVRARAFKTDYAPSNVDTHSYLFLDQVINQPSNPAGFPATWKTVTADYEMDPEITTDPAYSNQMTTALQQIPSMSISTDNDHLFSDTTGIYANPTSKGVAWERPASVELFDKDNVKEFQVNCGLRIQGGFFRSPTATQKHSFRLLFKTEYGPGRLRHNLFPGTDAVESFDTLVLRAGGNDGYSWGGAGNTVQWTRDNFGRDLMGSLGHPSSHGRFVHLYVNGLYWGLYNLVERTNEDFGADYFGGESEDWDANNAGEFKNGDSTAWNALQSAASAATTVSDYYAMQGLLPDGRRDLSKDILLDKLNYIDYMMVNIWGGNWDWPNKNYWFGRLRTSESTGFKFYMWDFENTMGNSRGRSPLTMVSPRSNVANSGVGQPHNQLKDHPEYQIDFADRVHHAFFNHGELSPTKLIPRYSNLVAKIEDAAIAESARWGDDNRATPHNQQEWKNERDWILGTYLPQRSDIVLAQFVADGLYPSLEAPLFNQHGGVVPRDFDLVMNAPTGIIYYTVDGSDPRMIGGAINSNALVYAAPITLTQPVLIKSRTRSGSTWSALNEAQFVLSESPLRVSEIMYHPAALSSNEVLAGHTRSDFEYIEFYNTTTQVVDLTTLRLSGGVDFDFSAGNFTELVGGATLLLVNNLDAFTLRYPMATNDLIAGTFSGNLGDDGEELILSETIKGEVQRFSYNDHRAWPLAADGAGHALVPLIDEGLDYGPNWRASAYRNGSPGLPDPMLTPPLFINEIGTNWVEVYAPSATAANDFYLSDDPDNLQKWMLPTNLLVSGWQSFDLPESGLNSTLFLSYLPGTADDRVSDAVRLNQVFRGQTWGRYPDGAFAQFALSPTRDAANVLAPAGVVLHEVMYHPAGNDLHPSDNFQDEYIVLQNTSNSAVIMQNTFGPWRLDGEADYTFPTNSSLGAGSFMAVVPFDPSDTTALANFAARYNISTNAIPIVGPFSGKLSNRSGRITLESPQSNGWSVVDELFYFDNAPFPIEADGLGAALHRAGPNEWQGGAPTLANDVIGLAPVLTLSGSVSNITWQSASLHASLLSTGSGPTSLKVYFGTSDGGSQSNTWDEVVQLGIRGTGLHSVLFDTLPADTTYHFRFRATNHAGSDWLDETVSFTTESDPRTGFEHHMKITFPGYVKPETLIQFPALIRLSAPSFDYQQVYSDKGNDLFFLDAEQTTLLPHEIESWNTNGTSAIWVQVPELSPDETCIWAYWGNTNAAASVPVAEIEGLELWLDAKELNLADNSAVTLWEDQSTTGRDASESTDPPTYVEDVINGHPVVRFDGVNDHLGFSNAGLSARTIFFVTRVNLGAKNLAGIIGRDGGDKGIRRISGDQWRNPGDGNDFTNPAGSTFFVNGQSGGVVAEDVWHIAAATRASTANTNYDSLGGYFNGREYGGDIAEVIIFNRVLTSEEQDKIGSYLAAKYAIATDYSGTFSESPVADGEIWPAPHHAAWHLSNEAVDSTENQFNGTVTNAVTTNAVIASGLEFNGASSSVTVPTTIGAPAALTASMWVQANVLDNQILLHKFPASNSAGYRIALDDAGGFQVRIGSANNLTELTAPNSYAANTWVHLATTFDNGSVRLYTNGVEVLHQSVTQTVQELNTPLTWGSDFTGKLDEVRLSATARSPGWLRASYLNQRPGSTFTSNSQVLTTNSNSDADELIDQWEITYFGDLQRDGSLDYDGDGHSDAEEMATGTDPTRAESVLFVIEQHDPASGQLTELQWPSNAGKRYTVSSATDLAGPWKIIASPIAATPPMNTWYLALSTTERSYYRVNVEE